MTYPREGSFSCRVRKRGGTHCLDIPPKVAGLTHVFDLIRLAGIEPEDDDRLMVKVTILGVRGKTSGGITDEKILTTIEEFIQAVVVPNVSEAWMSNAVLYKAFRVWVKSWPVAPPAAIHLRKQGFGKAVHRLRPNWTKAARRIDGKTVYGWVGLRSRRSPV